MNTTIRINKKTGFAYIPKDIREEGYQGEVETIGNAFTITLIKPGVSLESAIKSIKISLEELELRLEHQPGSSKGPSQMAAESP